MMKTNKNCEDYCDSLGYWRCLGKIYSRRGVNLFLSAIKINKLEKVKSKCTNFQNIKILYFNLTYLKNADAMIQKACELYEGKDVLINNNWACQRRLSAETDFKFFEKLLDINFLSTVSMSRSILPLFKKQEGGQFDIVSSVLRKFSSPFKLVYAASKHVLHGFIDSMRMEHYKDNIAAILIFLGFVCTPIAMNSLQRKWQSSSIGIHGD